MRGKKLLRFLQFSRPSSLNPLSLSRLSLYTDLRRSGGAEEDDGVPATLGEDFLRERAAMMRESLQKSQTITDNVVSILGSFDHRLSALETAMRHTQALKGPHEDLESYLGAIDQLRGNSKFFSSQKGFKSSDLVLNQSNTLLAKAISKLEDEFRQLLLSYSKPVEPERLFDCQVTMSHVLLAMLQRYDGKIYSKRCKTKMYPSCSTNSDLIYV